VGEKSAAKGNKIPFQMIKDFWCISHYSLSTKPQAGNTGYCRHFESLAMKLRKLWTKQEVF